MFGSPAYAILSLLAVIGSIPAVIWLLRQPPIDDTPAPLPPGRVPVRRR